MTGSSFMQPSWQFFLYFLFSQDFLKNFEKNLKNFRNPLTIFQMAQYVYGKGIKGFMVLPFPVEIRLSTDLRILNVYL